MIIYPTIELQNGRCVSLPRGNMSEAAIWHVDPVEKARDFVWLVFRHEIDYRGNIGPGESVTGETWIPGEARGATSARRVDFRDSSGKVIVSALTTWAMLDRATQRLVRVRSEVIAPFRHDGNEQE